MSREEFLGQANFASNGRYFVVPVLVGSLPDPLNAFRDPLNALRDPLFAFRGSLNAFRGSGMDPLNANRGFRPRPRQTGTEPTSTGTTKYRRFEEVLDYLTSFESSEPT